MNWRNLKTDKPQEDQRVLLWSAALWERDMRIGFSAPGIRMGRYIAGELRPDGHIGFKCAWWMPLPEPPQET